jgi:hypothetical protein
MNRTKDYSLLHRWFMYELAKVVIIYTLSLRVVVPTNPGYLHVCQDTILAFFS